MLLAVAVLLGALYALSVLGLFLYGANAYVMMTLHRRSRRRPRPAPPPLTGWPSVTVQLPIYNERYVARRLLDTIGALDYPADRLEIQILDDSTDGTTAILAERARALVARGLNVVHVRRRVRVGFKAGALAAGLKEASGEFIAIFDADFVPPPEFLRSTLPHFADPSVAVVQARWGHLNLDYSLLTAAQGLGIDGHFAVEQPARHGGGLLLNFNGTAGVWRRIAIEDAGGWAHDTLTEDLDLSYRAQLRGWRVEYRPEIVCPAELPVLVTGFKSQQRRWAKGSIQTAMKLLPMVLRSSRSIWVKYQATIHLTYYLIHPLMLLVVLLFAPMLLAREVLPTTPLLAAASPIFGLAALGPGAMLVYAQRVLGPGWLRRARHLPVMMVIGVGVAWSTSLAALSGLGGRDRTFVRTPKFGIGSEGGQWRGKAYAERRPQGALVEMALGGYCVATACLYGLHGEYTILPFLLLYACGFFAVGGLTLVHTREAGKPLTGADLRRTRVAVAVALATVLLAWGCPAEGGDLDALVAAGERWWSTSPDPRNPVACATCHHDPTETRGWAASFPKFRPLPPPHGRVMTLLQANAEAVRRHYRLVDPRAAATAITAHLAAQGAGVPLSPGIAAGQPVFPARLRALARSVARGGQLYADRCAPCHDVAAFASTVVAIPRPGSAGAQPLEDFLEAHATDAAPLGWDSQAMADLLGYLTAARANRPRKERS